MVASCGNSGGLMLLWRKDLVVSVLFFSAGHIDAFILMDDGFCWQFRVSTAILPLVKESFLGPFCAGSGMLIDYLGFVVGTSTSCGA